VLVIGDIMLDEIITGKVERLAPNAPIPVFLEITRSRYLGGAGNVYVNINKLNISCDFCGVVGNDEEGKYIASYIKETSRINYLRVMNLPTTKKVRCIDVNGKEYIRIDREKKNCISQKDYHFIESEILKNIRRYNILVFSDYGKGFLNEQFVQEIIGVCKSFGIKTIVDTKDKNLKKYKGCTVIKISKNDFEEYICDQTLYDENSVVLKKQVSELETESFVVTSGKDDILLFQKDGRKYTIETEKVNAIDVTGAGDVFISVIAEQLYYERNIFEAIEYAKKVSGKVIQNIGTSIIDKVL